MLNISCAEEYINKVGQLIIELLNLRISIEIN